MDTSMTHAKQFLAEFFYQYDYVHRHSGIGLYTPSSVHDGSAETIQAHRQKVLDDAYAAHPRRFHGHRPQAPTLPAKVWIM